MKIIFQFRKTLTQKIMIMKMKRQSIMKKTLLITSLLIAFLLFIKFTKSEKEKPSTNSFSDFPRQVELKGKKSGLKLDFKIAYLDVYDSLLLITESKTVNTIHLYNKNNFAHLLSTGKIGRGPGEIKSPGFYVFDKEKGILWTPDLGDDEIMKWEIERLVKKRKSYQPAVTYNPPSCLWPTPCFSQLNDSTFLYRVQDNPNYYLYAANKKGKVIDSLNIKNKTEIYPDVSKKDLTAERLFTHIVHPSEERIIIAYRHADIIVGIDYKGNILFQAQGPDMIRESPSKNNKKVTYSSIKYTENKIFGLYNGGHIRKGPKDKPKYSENIFVFDWQGQPIANLRLEHPTQSFALDKENERIITYAADLGEIVCYELPSSLFNESE